MAAPLVSENRDALEVADAQGVTLQGDAVRLAQIFGNLLTNAAKLTPAGGRIVVSIARAPGRVLVTVRDNGRGIARDQLGRIFEPFVQAGRERDARRRGLGLGLAIVNNLVVRHGGSITARPGRARRRERAGPAAPALDRRLDDCRRRQVDDDAGAPVAALTDVGLPVLDGYELARALRAEHGPAPTLIAATGYGHRNDQLRAVEAGFDCHLIKPVSVRDLVLLLDQRVVDVTAFQR